MGKSSILPASYTFKSVHERLLEHFAHTHVLVVGQIAQQRRQRLFDAGCDGHSFRV